MRVASVLIVVTVIFTRSFFTQAGQTTNPPAVYTAGQADAGRMEVRKNAFGDCASCHSTTLTGRIGNADELPPLRSLSEDNQKMINNYGGKVPALAGAAFRTRWAGRTTKDLTREFEERFAPPLTEETRLNIIAYILQVNGALPGKEPLTMATDVGLRTLFPIGPSQ